MSETSLPLNQLKVGQSGVIVKVNLSGAARQRLLAMGLVKGETIQVERIAPLGDPMDFLIKSYHLSLRKAEAGDILVQPVSV